MHKDRKLLGTKTFQGIAVKVQYKGTIFWLGGQKRNASCALSPINNLGSILKVSISFPPSWVRGKITSAKESSKD